MTTSTPQTPAQKKRSVSLVKQIRDAFILLHEENLGFGPELKNALTYGNEAAALLQVEIDNIPTK